MDRPRATLATAMSACLLGALVASPAWPEPAAWMKKARPNELGLRLAVHDDCPSQLPRYERLIASVFREHWIERIAIAPREVHLRVTIWCQTSIALYPFTIHAEFAIFDEPFGKPHSMGPGYDAAGAGSYAEILMQTESIVRQALNDHVVANFDL
jgi:hypothetical protein